MKYVVLIAIVVVAVILFDRYKKNQAPSGLIYRISWFELQVSDTFRFAIIPQQPILLTLEPSRDAKGSVILVDKQRNLTGYDTIQERLNGIVTKLGIMALPQRQAEKCFDEGALKTPSVHLRLRYADGRQWASVYSLDDVPPQVAELIESCGKLTREVYGWGGQQVTGEQARNSLKEAAQVKDAYNSDVILKVSLKLNGDILLNGKPVVWSELLIALDNLVKEKGAVWYSRENPDAEPNAELDKKIKVVLDEIIKRKLPIKLLKEDSK